MACGSCGKNKTGLLGSAKNLMKAASQQPEKIKWFREGVAGIAKCVGQVSIYSDEQIQANRDKCRDCPHSTKKDGKLSMTSQCMAPDPKRGGAPCGCFVICKTQSDECPLGHFTQLTTGQTGG